MKHLLLLLITTLIITGVSQSKGSRSLILKTYLANNPKIQYVGRVDFTDKLKPKFWAPGVYIIAKFKGTNCEITLEDECLGNNQNYVDIVIDGGLPRHIKLSGKMNHIGAGNNLDTGKHKILICKSTESGIGYLAFTGITCFSLLRPDPLPERKIEFIGNSITCGSSMDTNTPCNIGQWYDHNNAYLSYGARIARKLNAQYHLTSVSGIGLMHSCCNMSKTMPVLYDKVNLKNDSIKWNFDLYQPDVVTVCLGQNDGIQDSTLFCTAYLNFLQQLRFYYPKATIICLTSPMADEKLMPVLQKYLISILTAINAYGDSRVFSYFYKKSYYHGCFGHPNTNEHQEIADELSLYITKIQNWY